MIGFSAIFRDSFHLAKLGTQLEPSIAFYIGPVPSFALSWKTGVCNVIKLFWRKWMLIQSEAYMIGDSK